MGPRARVGAEGGGGGGNGAGAPAVAGLGDDVEAGLGVAVHGQVGPHLLVADGHGEAPEVGADDLEDGVGVAVAAVAVEVQLVVLAGVGGLVVGGVWGKKKKRNMNRLFSNTCAKSLAEVQFCTSCKQFCLRWNFRLNKNNNNKYKIGWVPRPDGLAEGGNKMHGIGLMFNLV